MTAPRYLEPVCVVATASVLGLATVRRPALAVMVPIGLIAALLVAKRAHRLCLGVAFALLLCASSSIGSLARVSNLGRFGGLLLISLVNLVAFGNGGARRRLNGLLAGLLVIGAMAFASVAWSADPSLSGQRALSWLLLVTAVATTASRYWRSPSEVRSDLRIVAGFGATVIVLSLLTFLARIGFASQGGQLRGLLSNANAVGTLGSLTVPLCLALAGDATSSRRSAHWTAAAGLSFVAVVLSQSRGGMLAAFVGGSLVFFRQGKRERRVRGRQSAILLLSMAVVVALSPLVVSRAISGAQHKGDTGRRSGWNLAVSLSEQRPLTGWGFGTTEEIFEPRIRQLNPRFAGGTVHDGYLQTLVEIGPIGLTGLLFAVAACTRRPRATAPTIVFGVRAALLAGLLDQVFESGITSAGNLVTFVFWLVAAAVTQLEHLTEVADPPVSSKLSVPTA